MHILLTCRRASAGLSVVERHGDGPTLSSAPRTMSNDWKKATSYCTSLMLPWIAVMLTCGLNLLAVSLATSALDRLTCDLLNRNWRFRLDRSIVSRSSCDVSATRRVDATDDGDVADAREHAVLEKLAADAAGADHEQARLLRGLRPSGPGGRTVRRCR